MNGPAGETTGSRSAWVAAEEVGLAELRLLAIARRCSGAGDEGRRSGPAGAGCYTRMPRVELREQR